MTNDQLQQLFESLGRVIQPHLQRSQSLRTAVGLLGEWLHEQAGDAAMNSGSASNRDTAGEHQSDHLVSSNGQLSSAHSNGSGSAGGGGASGDAASGGSGRYTQAGFSGPTITGPTVAPTSLQRSSSSPSLRTGDLRGHIVSHGTNEEIGRARGAASESHATITGAFVPGAYSAPPEVDIAVVEKRCRLKAQACDLAVLKRQNDLSGHHDSDAEILQQLNAMVVIAKELPNCFLWTFWRERPLPDDATILTASRCYITLADAAALMRKVDDAAARGIAVDDAAAMRLLAEADSALRVVLARTWIEEDRDQVDVHHWLRRATAQRRVYIERFMTMSDPADPTQSAELAERIRATSSSVEDVARQDKAIKKPLSQVRYHSNFLSKLPAGDPAEQVEHWKKIAEGLHLLAQAHVMMSDPRIAEALAPIVTLQIPEVLSEDRELAAALQYAAKPRGGDAEAMPDEDDDQTGSRPWSEQVLAVREWLRGGRLVIVGGERRQAAVDQFVSAFELKEVDWIDLVEHGSSAPLRTAIQRLDTSAVLLIVKLIGHLHAEKAQQWADESKVPCAWLKADYNPERAARDILEQLAGRFGQNISPA